MTPYLHHNNDFTNPDVALMLDETSLWGARFGALLLNNLALHRDLNILDVGCGTGFPTFELANIHGPSCQVVGLDVWTQALDRAKAKLRAHNLPNVRLVEADAAQTPFGDSEFDLIVSNLGVNNFEQPQAALAECFRVAKPGACIALTTNVKGHMAEFYEVYRETLVALNKTAYLEKLSAHEDHRGTKESVCALLEGAGFDVVRTIEDNFYLRYLDGSALLNHSFIKLGFLDAWRGVVGPDEEVEVFRVLESRLNEAASQQGELRLTVPMLYVEGQKP